MARCGLAVTTFTRRPRVKLRVEGEVDPQRREPEPEPGPEPSLEGLVLVALVLRLTGCIALEWMVSGGW
jgi:hypothetical protein